MKPEDFARFLKLLSPNDEEAGVLYTCLQMKLIGFFNLKGISDPMSAADEAIDRTAVKISTGSAVTDVERFCFGIARNIAKERARLMRREYLAFNNFIEDISNSSAEQVERIYSLLKPCFEQLAVEEQQLLLAYCHNIRGRARTEHRRQLAEKMKTTVLALRVRVTRLRKNLTACVKKLSNNV